jgi:hypothetical protein
MKIEKMELNTIEQELLEKALFDLREKFHRYEQESLRTGDRYSRLMHQDLQRYIDLLSIKIFGREPACDQITMRQNSTQTMVVS